MSRRLLAAIAFTWAFAIFTAYYIYHKPFDPAVALAITRLLRDGFAAGAILTVSGGVGRRIAPLSGWECLLGLCVQAGLGLGIASLLWLLAGAAGLYRAWFAWGLLLVGAVLLKRPILGWLSDLASVPARVPREDRFAQVLAGLAVLWLVLSLGEALAPPVKFDALVYHLALPARFVQAGRLFFTPDNPFWGFPLASGMLDTWAILLGRPETAAVLGWMIGVTALVGVLGLASTWGTRAGWIAVAALLAGESTAASLGWAYADWLAVLYGVGLIAALLEWRGRSDSPHAALAGAMAGLAVGAKLTAGVGVVAGAAVLLAGRKRQSLASVAVFLLSAGLFTLPWLIKNLIGAGGALYPFLPAAGADALRAAFYRGATPGLRPIAVVLTPILATLRGVEGAPGYAASIGPLLLALPLGALMLRRDRAELQPLIVFLLTGWAVWALGSAFSELLGQSRLYALLFPAWAALAGAGYEGYRGVAFGRVRLARLVQALILLALGFSALVGTLNLLRAQPLSVALGLESAESYLSRRLGYFEPAMQSAGSVPGSGSAIELWEPRSLYCLPSCSPDAWLDRWYLARRTLVDPEVILNSWEAAGATHLLLYRSGMEFVRSTDGRYTQADWEALDRLLAELGPAETFGGAYDWFRLRP